MPYIIPDLRDELDIKIPRSASNSNQLAYQISQLLNDYIQNNGRQAKTFADVFGSMELVKLEIQRRLVAPYNDLNLSRYGDVFPTIQESEE